MNAIVRPAAMCCVILAVMGCSEKPAPPPANVPAGPTARPNLGEPATADDIAPEIEKRQAAPENGTTTPAEPAINSPDPKASDPTTENAASPENGLSARPPESANARAAESGARSTPIDDTIDDVDEEE